MVDKVNLSGVGGGCLRGVYNVNHYSLPYMEETRMGEREKKERERKRGREGERTKDLQIICIVFVF